MRGYTRPEALIICISSGKAYLPLTEERFRAAAADYYPYGKILRQYSCQPNRYLSTHHERDKDTGYDNRGARLYDSEIGRFLGVDPLADHPNQIMMSPYQYVWGNPVSLADPDGRCPDCPTFQTDDGGTVRSSILANNIPVVTPPSWSTILGQNRFSSWKSLGCDCGLSSNVPTSGATGYASDVANVASIGIGGFLVAPLMAGMGLSLPSASTVSTMAKANLGASGTRFMADAAVQYTIISAQGGDFSREYNYASGVSSGLISNPFLGAGLGGAFNVSRDDIDFSLSRGVASSLIGGAFGKAMSKAWKPASSNFSKLTWVGGFGKTISMENPIVTGIDTGINFFSKSSTKLGAKFFSNEDLSKED